MQNTNLHPNKLLFTMANNTTLSIQQYCPMIHSIQKLENKNSLIGLQLLIGIDVLPALFTIVANAVFFLTIIKTRSLHTPSNALLAALCFNDLLVGVGSQPIFLAVIIKLQSFQAPNLALTMLLKWSGILLNGMSFTIVLYITIDRYVAVCHPFLYQRKSTSTKYCIIVALTWVVKAVYSILSGEAHTMVYGIVTIISFGVMIFCYIKIYLVIAQKERTVLCLGTIGTEQRKILRQNKEERSKTFIIIILLTVFIISYLPPFVSTLVIIHVTKHTLQICSLCPNIAVVFLWSIFYMNLSSVINPIVYCIYMRSIRKAAVKMVFSRNNRVSHR